MRKPRLILTIIACAACLAASAQNTATATIEAARVVIKKYPAVYVEQITDELCEKFKKNPEVMSGIADAYFTHQMDTMRAYKYLRRALEVDPNHAPAYLLAGKMEEEFSRDPVKAGELYRKGIEVDPSSPGCYLAYSKMVRSNDPAEAQRYLEALVTQKPDYPIDFELGKMYYDLSEKQPTADEKVAMMQKSAEYFGRCDMDIMDKYYLYNYGIVLYYTTSNYERAFEVSEFGVEKFRPDNALFCRLGVTSAFKLARWADAANFSKELMAADSADVTPNDYLNLAIAYKNMGKTADAVSVYQSLIDNDSMPEADKLKYNIYVHRAEAYAKDGEWDKCMKLYAENIKKKIENGVELEVTDFSRYADAYKEMAVELNGPEKANAYWMADSLYRDAANRFTEHMGTLLYLSLDIRETLEKKPDNPDEYDYSLNYAKPIAEQLASVLSAKSERNSTENVRLGKAYYYLMGYYFNTKKYKQAKEYSLMILDIFPDNNSAKTVYEATKKY